MEALAAFLVAVGTHLNVFYCNNKKLMRSQSSNIPCYTRHIWRVIENRWVNVLLQRVGSDAGETLNDAGDGRIEVMAILRINIV